MWRISPCSCHVDSAFRGTDSNVVVLSVVRQYSDNPKKIGIGDEYGGTKCGAAVLR